MNRTIECVRFATTAYPFETEFTTPVHNVSILQRQFIGIDALHAMLDMLKIDWQMREGRTFPIESSGNSMDTSLQCIEGTLSSNLVVTKDNPIALEIFNMILAAVPQFPFQAFIGEDQVRQILQISELIELHRSTNTYWSTTLTLGSKTFTLSTDNVVPTSADLYFNIVRNKVTLTFTDVAFQKPADLEQPKQGVPGLPVDDYQHVFGQGIVPASRKMVFPHGGHLRHRVPPGHDVHGRQRCV